MKINDTIKVELNTSNSKCNESIKNETIIQIIQNMGKLKNINRQVIENELIRENETKTKLKEVRIQ